MREIVSPLSGLRSPIRSRTNNGDDGEAAAISLLGAETTAFSLDFTVNWYAKRTA